MSCAFGVIAFAPFEGADVFVSAETAELEQSAGQETDGQIYSAKKNTEFELPVSGATGFSYTLTNGLEKGEAFTILEARQEDRTLIVEKAGGGVVQIPMTACFINLPDVIPSIIYCDTNGISSVFTSSLEPIANVTGEKLYDSISYNNRLDGYEFTMPILYEAAEELYAIQQKALADGYSIVLYQAFRPLSCQVTVRENLDYELSSSSVIKAGLGGWGKGWFIAQGLSNHQYGGAVDVSLARVTRMGVFYTGSYRYCKPVNWELCEMQSPMHELSALSVDTATNKTDEELYLRRLFVDDGWRPLRSEWWHFDCVDALRNRAYSTDGDFWTYENLSTCPEIV